MKCNTLEEIYEEAQQARNMVERVRDTVGNLDDIYQTEYIDNRRTVGAYQHLSNAIAMVELFMFKVLEEIENE
jgi:hypothetical protein